VGSNPITDVAKAAGAKWKGLTDAERFPYEEKFKVKMKEYATAVAAYRVANPEASKDDEEDEADESESEDSDERREAKRLRKLKRLRRKDKTIPRKPSKGGFGVFCAESRAEIKASLPAGSNSMTDVMKVAGAKWKSLTDAERHTYTEKYAAQKAAYAVAWAAYKEAHPEAEEEGRLRKKEKRTKEEGGRRRRGRR